MTAACAACFAGVTACVYTSNVDRRVECRRKLLHHLELCFDTLCDLSFELVCAGGTWTSRR